MLSLIFALVLSAHAQRQEVTPEDIERLSGFAQHKKQFKQYDKDREAGFKDYLKELAEWDAQHKKAAQEQRKIRKEKGPPDDIQAYREHLAEEREWMRHREVARRDLVQDKAKLRKHPLVRQLSEEEELDVIVKRPRFDFRKRGQYSGGGSAAPSMPMRPGRSRPGGGGGGADFQAPPPPPPSFDDFPPPPPPSFDNPEDFPPPPPPPPAFDDYGDFPPPPPPPPPPGDFPEF